MYSGNTTVYKQARPFIFVSPKANNNNSGDEGSYGHYPDDTLHSPPNPSTIEVSSPASSSSSSASSVLYFPSNQPQQDSNASKQDNLPKKKRRQHVGYACDKCRERRVGCDRGKPTCGQCKDRYTCQYSNHALRLDNVSMRQRLEDLENQVSWLTSIITKIETDYHQTAPKLQSQPVVQPKPCLTLAERGPSVCDWAFKEGWPVIETENDVKMIFTNIKTFEGLRAALKSTIETLYQIKKPTLHHQPTQPTNPKEHTFTLFESLNRYRQTKVIQTNQSHHLETDVKTRLIQQHHQCGFPILVSPARFETHFRQGQLQSLVLSSIFSHTVPHCCIYHPYLVQIQNFRELGNQFYDHSHDLLDDTPSLSNIHQRTLLITYDLDMGRVQRAFIQIGIAIRMCFLLNLHRPEGYVRYQTAYEREQAKRIFWAVWFYDNMVPHLYHDQISAIKPEQITIELPTPLAEFGTVELDQTMFAVDVIEIRKIVMERKVRLLRRFYGNLPDSRRFGRVEVGSVWGRRRYYCVLLDYCLGWLMVYRAWLPPAQMEDRPLTRKEQEAVLHTSQAAVAMVQIFQQWFDVSLKSGDGFDCYFRPYLYHFIGAKNIFSANVSQQGRSPALVYVSRGYLVLLLKLYQTTPTRNSVEESALEKSILEFLDRYKIGTHEVVYPGMLDEALVDDPSADGGWSIFSRNSGDQDSSVQDEYLTGSSDSN